METIRSSRSNDRRAIFLDRDGVLVEDVAGLVRAGQIRILEGVPEALALLRAAGFKLIVVTNQTVVARGLLRESDLLVLQKEIERLLAQAGAPPLHGFYYCPHHPRATVPRYRVLCTCRKPRPGLVFGASRVHAVDPEHSIFIGDRMSDIAAGAAAGCATVLVETGKHLDPPIESAVPIDPGLYPDAVCGGLLEAARLILEPTRARMAGLR